MPATRPFRELPEGAELRPIGPLDVLVLLEKVHPVQGEFVRRDRGERGERMQSQLGPGVPLRLDGVDRRLHEERALLLREEEQVGLFQEQAQV